VLSLTLELNLELTAFATSQIDNILTSAPNSNANQENNEEIPELEEVAVTRLGDVWLCGEGRLICGNALEAETSISCSATNARSW
jgi:hypothetical protein